MHARGTGIDAQVLHENSFVRFHLSMTLQCNEHADMSINFNGGLAQMVERSLCMREVLGSMPRFSMKIVFVQGFHISMTMQCNKHADNSINFNGGLAQMVERSLSMREALGSMPRFSTFYSFFN